MRKFIKKIQSLAKGKKKTDSDIFCSAIVAAAGSSSRMNGINKILSLLCGVPVLIHSLRAMDENKNINEIIVVAREEDIFNISSLCQEYRLKKVTKVICGGANRAESVYRGLQEISQQSTLVAIHDGARPLVSQEVISETIQCALRYHAAAPAIPVKDTIKQAANRCVIGTPDRRQLYAIQTPQIFETDLYKGAISYVLEKNLEITDDCMAVEAIGAKVYLSQGSYENIKITTPIDLCIADGILRMREER